MYRSKRNPTKLTFEGLTIVLLPDECTRGAVRLFRGNTLTAVLQRNGNVGVARTGIFESPNEPRCQLRVAKCLHGLKLLNDEMLARYQSQFDAYDSKLDFERLQREADYAGYRLVKLPKPKKVPKK